MKTSEKDHRNFVLLALCQNGQKTRAASSPHSINETTSAGRQRREHGRTDDGYHDFVHI